MKVLITSGTGKVGTEVTKRLLKRGYEPVIMTHDLTHLHDLPEGVEGIFADFEKPESWEETLRGIDRICLITPSIMDEAKFGTQFVKMLDGHEFEQIIFLSIYNAEAGSHIPHFFAKLEMEEALKKTGIPYTFIRANNFFQNDELYFQGMEEHGLYLQPIGNVGLNRVDVRDVADAIENALLSDKHLNQTYPLVGPDDLTGRKTAMLYSEIMGKKISYPANCLQMWEDQLKEMLPEWQLEEYKMMYEFFLIDGLPARGDAHDRRNIILGKAPRRFEDFAKELVAHHRTSGLEKLSKQKPPSQNEPRP